MHADEPRIAAPTRRHVLLGGLGVVGAGVLAACGSGAPADPKATYASSSATPASGRRTVAGALRPRPVTADIGGITVETWGYSEELGAPVIEATAGDVIRMDVENALPRGTSVHWHGIALDNAADGVPGMTQDPIAPGSTYTYEFQVPHGGTYFYHSHSGVQIDRGLYGPLIIRDPADRDDQDVEWTMVLDDWTDGAGPGPDQILDGFRTMGSGAMSDGGMPGEMGHGGGMSGMPGEMGHGGRMSGMGGDMGGGMSHGTPDPVLGDAGDVQYPHYLINGRVPAAHRTFRAKPGAKARIRFINAGGDTIFKVALGGHRMTITHTDGFPVEPREVDSFYISMGERFDVEVMLADGVFPLIAVATGKDDRAFAVVRTGGGDNPAPEAAVPQLATRGLLGHELRPAERARLTDKPVDNTTDVQLTGQMMPYTWGMSGPLPVTEGQRMRMRMRNTTDMPHPMHLHGHTWALPGSDGLRKDTVLVLPGESIDADLDATNPGEWAYHCHNAYHMEVGMLTSLKYT